MLERDFQKRVISWLREQGCYVLNVPGGSQIPKGTPDLLCCIAGRFYALELKTDTGRVSDLQKHNLVKIRESGGEAIVLRPSSFDSFKSEVMNLVSA